MLINFGTGIACSRGVSLLCKWLWAFWLRLLTRIWLHADLPAIVKD